MNGHVEGDGLLSEQSEVVVGEIPAVASLALGSERLRLFFTSKRIIFAHIGKRGLGAVATTSLFGGMSGAFENLFKSGKESQKKRRLELLSPGEILAADKDNFSISYDEIVHVDVTQTAGLTGITILTADDKFELSTSLGFEKTVGLFGGNLGRKLSVKRLN